MIGETLKAACLGFDGGWFVELRFTETKISVTFPSKESSLVVFNVFHLLVGDVVLFFEQTDHPVFTFHFENAGLCRFGDGEAMR